VADVLGGSGKHGLGSCINIFLGAYFFDAALSAGTKRIGHTRRQRIVKQSGIAKGMRRQFTPRG